MANIAGRKATVFICDANGEDVELTASVISCSFETDDIELEFEVKHASIGAEIVVPFQLVEYLVMTIENSMTLIGGTIFSRN